MKITDVRCAVLGNNPVVRIVTDAGLEDLQNLDYNQMLDKLRTAAAGNAAPDLARMPILWGVEFAAKAQLAGVRHGHLRIDRRATPGALPGRIYTVEPTGDVTFVHARIGEDLVVASTSAGFAGRGDDPIWVTPDQDHLYLFDARTNAAL